MIKKLAIISGSLLLAISLTGCGGDATASVSSDKTLIKVGDESIDANNIYTTLQASDTTADSVQSAITKILVKKAVKVTKTITAEAQATLASTKESDGDNFLSNIKSQGYSSEKDYYNNYVLINTLKDHLVEAYVKDDFDEVADTYIPRQVQIIQCNTKENYDKAVAAIKKKNANWESIASQYGATKNFDGSKIVVTKKTSSIADSVWTKIKNVTTNGTVIKKTVASDSVGQYYIVKVVNTNPSKFKSAVVNNLNSLATKQDSSSSSTSTTTTTTSTKLTKLSDKAYNYFLNKYDYSIHDVNVNQALLTSSYKYKED